MHSIGWLTPMVFALGCASQSSNADRQLHEQEERLKRLTATCDRMEERVIALEAAAKGRFSGSRGDLQGNPQRPELPTVKVTPERPEAEPISNGDSSSDTSADDNRRVVIVGEGSRLEAREAGESNSTPTQRPSGKAKPRASKSNQGSLPKASTPGAPQ